MQSSMSFTPADIATRQNRDFVKRANNITGTGVLQIITLSGIVRNVGVGTRILVPSITYGVVTPSKSCEFEFGYTNAADGAGVFVPITPAFFVGTDVTLDGFKVIEWAMPYDRLISYLNDGARSVTFRINTSDNATDVTLGWTGYWENERRT